jgi:hypothetical protein
MMSFFGPPFRCPFLLSFSAVFFNCLFELFQLSLSAAFFQAVLIIRLYCHL